MSNSFNFTGVMDKFRRTQRDLPVLLANQAQTYFADTFKQQGIEGQGWKEVKRRIPGTPEYKYPKFKGLQRRESPILVGAGYRKRGGTLRARVNRSVMEKTWTRIRLAVDLPYAKIQNEGGMAGRNHAANIPARPYMKHTRELETKQRQIIDTQMNKIWTSE